MVKLLKILLLLSFAVTVVPCQDAGKTAEANLKQFVGKTVVLKIDMPATLRGVELWPEKPGVKDPKLAVRIKEYGRCPARGASATVTEVAISTNEIVFMLDGGGYGTPEDRQAEPRVSSRLDAMAKSPDELRWENEIRTARDRGRIIYLQGQLAQARTKRELIDRQNRERYDKTAANRKKWIRQARLKKGSRFILKFIETSTSIKPEQLIEMLADYVDFSPPVVDDLTKPPAENELPKKPGGAEVKPYVGEWRNGLGETLSIDDESLRFSSGTALRYNEHFRLAAEHLFVIVPATDHAGGGPFVLIKTTGTELRLTFYKTLKDLKNGTNSEREETWSKR